jgi:hypothetical protein
MELASDGVTIWCKCDSCGSKFDVKARGYGPKRRPRRYCGPQCRPSSLKRKTRVSEGRASRAFYQGVTTLLCPYCRQPFEHDVRKGGNRKYCSVECRYQLSLVRERNHRAVPPAKQKVCLRCESVFEQRKGNPKYCTAKCRDAARRDRVRPAARQLRCYCCNATFLHIGRGVPKACSRPCRRALWFVASNPLCSLDEARKAFIAKAESTGCDACGQITTFKDGREGLSVDHCHITGRIRGILCQNCNKIEGLVSGSSDVLRMLADWIDQRGTIK